MADMWKFTKKSEFPAQTRERLQWILDVVRENQSDVTEIIDMVRDGEAEYAKDILANMHKSDRDALLQPNGILTDEQIELLK